jgi:hypothetical protein
VFPHIHVTEYLLTQETLPEIEFLHMLVTIHLPLLVSILVTILAIIPEPEFPLIQDRLLETIPETLLVHIHGQGFLIILRIIQG